VSDKQRHINRLTAFSVLEVTIVIALMALLSALFFGALNRFGEQIQNETTIKNELNNWYVIRANLWRELDEADSIHVRDNQASIWLGKTQRTYKIINNHLFRVINETETDLKLEMNAIQLEETKGHQYVAFKINWKDDEMVLRYPVRSTVAHQVNHYFTQQLWQ
jgi:type II secretory pathway pseudopilin PulG